MLKYVIALAIFAVLAVVIYIRLSPSDIPKYNQRAEPREIGDYNFDAGFIAVRAMTISETDMRGAINRVILQTPRTRRVAGTLESNAITYETRSLLFGFPDFATVSFLQPREVGSETPLLVIDSRLRFGLYGMGVNTRRVLGWLEQLGPLTVAP